MKTDDGLPWTQWRDLVTGFGSTSNIEKWRPRINAGFVGGSREYIQIVGPESSACLL